MNKENSKITLMRNKILSSPAKKIYIFLVLILHFALLNANNTELFTNFTFLQGNYFQNFKEPYIYNKFENPAYFSHIFKKSYTIYNISAGQKSNGYHRRFDPRSENQVGFDLQWIKQLNRNSTLASGLKFHREYHKNVYNSLEKNYYANYFSITDTTQGHVNYQGPNLWLLYNHSLSDRLKAGLEIDYGIERGLKNVYTECKTIFIDIDSKFGLVYSLPDLQANIGLNLRYFNHSGKYEAVKEYQDAFIKTWIGYNLFIPEKPNATIRKNDNRAGYNLGLHLNKNKLFGSNWGIRIITDLGTQSSKIDVGRPANTKKRGYWQRNGYRLVLNPFYNDGNIDIELVAGVKLISDWGMPKDYEVITFENQRNIARLGGFIKSIPVAFFELNCGYEYKLIKSNYDEYAGNFHIDEKRLQQFANLGIQHKFNSKSKIYYQYFFERFEPDFHWTDTDYFNSFEFLLGFEQSSIFGVFNINMNYSSATPNNVSKRIEKFGINLGYRK